MINEMTKKLVMASALCATLIAVDANAVPFFDGSVGFADGATVVSPGSVDLATKVSMNPFFVFAGPGDFAGLSGDMASPAASITISPVPVSVIPLFTVAAGHLEFDASSMTVTRDGTLHTLTLTGLGEFIDTKGVKTHATTLGKYSLTFGESGSTIGYELTANTLTLVVPDGGYTLMLLGASLSGLGAFRFTRKGSSTIA
jgi:hypothetical protein